MKSGLKKYFAANRAEPESAPRRRSQAQRDIDRKEKARLRMAKTRAELKTRPLEEQVAYAARSRAYQERYRERTRTRIETILAKDDIPTGCSAYPAESEFTKKTQLSYILCAGGQKKHDDTAPLPLLNTSAAKQPDAMLLHVSQHPIAEDSQKTQLSYILCPGTQSKTHAGLEMPKAHPEQNLATEKGAASATRFRAHGSSRENRGEREMVLTQTYRLFFLCNSGLMPQFKQSPASRAGAFAYGKLAGRVENPLTGGTSGCRSAFQRISSGLS
ncbi:hypothetical protein C8R47DRAFT_797439 [Mycena vitilis]|nr:hypothetical protein C8R47DRAFT_797439 [Mycena vitilis]